MENEDESVHAIWTHCSILCFGWISPQVSLAVPWYGMVLLMLAHTTLTAMVRWQQCRGLMVEPASPNLVLVLLAGRLLDRRQKIRALKIFKVLEDFSAHHVLLLFGPSAYRSASRPLTTIRPNTKEELSYLPPRTLPQFSQCPSNRIAPEAFTTLKKSTAQEDSSFSGRISSISNHPPDGRITTKYSA